MKTKILICILALQYGLTGCGRSDSSSQSTSTTIGQPLKPQAPVADTYRQIRPDDGIRYIARTHSEINRGGVVEEIGFHLYLIGPDGKEFEIPLLSTTVTNSQVETRDFGTLKLEANINSLTLLATETQITKLRALVVNSTSTDSNGESPLHLAAYKGQKDVVQSLLGSGANVNVKDQNNDTPLHMAAYQGQEDIAQLLISKHCDVNFRDNDGDSPLHLARQNGHKEIMTLLLGNGADVNAKDKLGKTCLHLAVAKNQVDIVQLLLDNKADVNAKDIKGDTPLHWAAIKGYPALISTLLAHNADVNNKDDEGSTPFHLAVNTGRADVQELLRQHGGHE